MIDIATLQALNAPTREERLENLQKAVQTASFPEANPVYINCHIHTTYSFSPYSPAAAVFAAKAEGLCTAGIVDHDTTAGAEAFIEAGKLPICPSQLEWKRVSVWSARPDLQHPGRNGFGSRRMGRRSLLHGF